MPVSTSAASLNRFPGLTLRAWALWDSGVLRASFNMASVTASATAPVFVFQSALSSAYYVIDTGISGNLYGQVATQNANGFTINIVDGAGVSRNMVGSGFVAVYGP